MGELQKAAKKYIKGKALIDFRKEADDALKVLNSVALNLSSALEEARSDDDFDYMEKLEFGQAIGHILDGMSSVRNKILKLNRKV